MKTFTGTEYLQIDIANCFGLDRLSWQDRIHWFNNNEPVLEQQDKHAKSPILYRKAVRALRAAQQGIPVNHSMGLDATASGLQIMAVLSGCLETGKAVNLVNTGSREDVYQSIADTMVDHGCTSITRDDVKKPVMTVFYGSKAQPKEVFGEGEELFVFYDALKEKLPGAFELMDILQAYWNPTAEYHSWMLPDGHKAHVPVTTVIDKQLEIDEADHLRVTYRSRILSPLDFSRSLAANIIHSIDGYVVREMVRKAKDQGFNMAPIHDCFYAHPNHMQRVRENYRDILYKISTTHLLKDILSDLAGPGARYWPAKEGLNRAILSSEYALS